MKALSIRQPWAWLIVAGFKDIENRTWQVRYRGPLLIHASGQTDRVSLAELEERYGVAIDRAALQVGGIIGRVDLVDIVRASDSRWFTGPYGWILARSKPLPFTLASGRQRLFDVSCANHDSDSIAVRG